MCITASPARLSKTKILSCAVGDKILLAYANSVANLSAMPNAMIFPVPGTLTKEDFIDSTPFAGFLNELQEAWTPRYRGLSSDTYSKSLGSVERFKSGMYEVFLSSADQNRAMSGKTRYVERLLGKTHRITEALKSLPLPNRPQIQESLLEWFDRYYPGWSLVVCVFEGPKAMDSQPVMFTYKPFDEFKGMAFFPAVDSHTGGPPNINEFVDVDHFLFTEHEEGMAVENTIVKNQVPDYLKGKKLIGVNFQHDAPNGDWVCKFADNAELVPVNLPLGRRNIFQRVKPVA